MDLTNAYIIFAFCLFASGFRCWQIGLAKGKEEGHLEMLQDMIDAGVITINANDD